MNFDMNPLTQRILDLTLEIIYLQNGEDYIVTKILGGSIGGRYQMSEGHSTTQSPGTEPPPQSLKRDTKNDQKVLKLSNKIIRLLTGEVPIRCEDVTVYLSTEEWEYVERHKELYEDVMMEDRQSVVPLDKSVSGKCHTAASLPDLENEYRTEDVNNNGGKCMKTNKTRKERVTARTEHESLTFNERNVTERDLYQHMEHTPIEYPSVVIIKEEPGSSDEENLSDSDSFKPSDDSQTEYSPTYMKDELASCEEGNFSDTDMYKPLEHTPAYLKGCSGRNAKLLDVNPGESFTESRKPDGRIYHEADVSPVTRNTDLAHNSMSSEMRKHLDSDSDFVTRETKCRGEEYATFSEDGENLPHRSDYLEPQEGHTEGQPFQCSECEQHFADSAALNTHQKIHTGEKLFKCTDCDKCFSSNIELFIHQKILAGENPFTCTECGKCFTHASDLARHKKTHKGGKPYKCPVCGKGFAQASAFARHKMIHTGENPYKCPECGKCFTQASDVAKHRKIHTGEKPHKCPECGKCFAQASDLAKHRRIHTGEKPHKCPICGKCFTQASDLSKHNMIHTGEKPYICIECGKCCTQASDLAKHRKIHTGEKPYKCLECGKCFTHSSSLAKHKVIHTGEKPYECTVCKKAFTQASNLARHRKIHNKEK